MLIEALKAFFIGVVEGITEWLPISSTGHMILVDQFASLDVSAKFLELFLVVIQIGAICAVIILYFRKLNPFSRKKTPKERTSTWRLWGMVVIGCIPAAVVGIAFDDFFTEHFYNPWTVAIALIVYGIIFILLEAHNRRREKTFLIEHSPTTPRGKHARVVKTQGDGDDAEMSLFKVQSVDEINWKTAIKIGCFQVLAIIPGTSRSGSTIIGGMLCGCSRTAAAEFTFFLAIPVMFGWGLLKLIKYIATIGLYLTSTEACVLVVGIVTAFVVSILSIKFLMGYIKQNDFTAFGVYRIILGICVLGYFGAKAIGIF